MNNNNDNENGTNYLLNVLISKIDRLEEKVDEVKENMVTEDDCNNNQTHCLNQFKLKKNELTPAKLTGYAAIITATFAGIAGIIKLFLG